MLLAPLTVVLLGLSMLAQRPVARWLKVPGPVWPLLPFDPAASWRHRLAVRGAGLALTAALIFAALFAQASREKSFTSEVEVVSGQPAAQAGLLTGDVVTAVDGTPTSDFAALRDALVGSARKRLSVDRGGRALELEVTLREGVLGVRPKGTLEGQAPLIAPRSPGHSQPAGSIGPLMNANPRRPLRGSLTLL